MAITLKIDWPWKKPAPIAEQETPATAAPVERAMYDGSNYGYNHIYYLRYTGEKNLGEMGPIRRYIADHDALRLRSWQLYLESEICQTVFQRFATWVIGSGLNMQAAPLTSVLERKGIKLDKELFNKQTEDLYRMYMSTKDADYSRNVTGNKLAHKAFINAIVGGDVLIVNRVDKKGNVTTQLIDGAHVATPPALQLSNNDYISNEGNRVRYGVELNDKNEHVAYYVKTGIGYTYERIAAKDAKTGLPMAYMVYGLEYRLDNVRGIPLISAVMETSKKMERYKEATIGSAEERQKIPYIIEHGITSTGENPMLNRTVKAMGITPNTTDLPADIAGKQLANDIMVSTNKTVINMPNDSTLKTLESKNELYFKDFYTVNIDIVCACVGIPPNVAMQKYDSNFSAARAALKDWEHSLNVKRNEFADMYYKPHYELWLTMNIAIKNIDAPGFMDLYMNQDITGMNAYKNTRFTGAMVPHIDPLKEVKAEREKLGSLAEHIPLTTVEAATEALNGGEAYANFEQYAKELKEAEQLGIEAPAPAGSTENQTTIKQEDGE